MGQAPPFAAHSRPSRRRRRCALDRRDGSAYRHSRPHAVFVLSRELEAAQVGSWLPDELATALPHGRAADAAGEQHQAAVHRSSARAATGSTGAYVLGARVDGEKHWHGADASTKLW